METNKVYNEDCIETMARMPADFIDLTVTSPPYDNLRSYKDNIDQTWGDHVWRPIIKELYRVTKPGGVVVWIVGDATINGSETGTSFKQALYFMDCGFNLHDTMIYGKNNYIPLTHNRYEQQFEYMFVFSKGKPSTFKPLMKINKRYGKIQGGTFNKNGGNTLSKRHKDNGVAKESQKQNIWFYNVGMNNSSKDKIAFKHRAIFPEKLATDHVISWSNKGDLIYDPFAGSGTVGKVSILNERNFILSEISGEYCEEIIKPRIKQARVTMNQLKLL